MPDDPRVVQARKELAALVKDERILPSERDLAFLKVLGDVRGRPTTLRQARLLIEELRQTLSAGVSEIPL